MYIVSACLLGANCKYNGESNDNEAVKDFCEGRRILTVCPETAGGLKAPRPPAEQVICSSGEGGGYEILRVIDKEGKDLTQNFLLGAGICMKKVRDAEDAEDMPELAILKANSPSCGSCMIYDGTFTGTLKEGDGLFAALVKKAGIRVVTEHDIESGSIETMNNRNI